MITVTDRIDLGNYEYINLDARYTDPNGNPFSSVSAAQTYHAGKMNELFIGLTVLVKESGWTEAKEYWVQPKGTTPETYGLVEKGAGTTDYADLDNKPTINNVPLSGNKTASDLGLATAEQGGKADTAIQGVSVNGTEVTPDPTTKKVALIIENGKSAYQLYLDNYEDEHGSTDGALDEAAWLESLQGKSALQIYNETMNTSLDEAGFINVLKQNYPMEYVTYNQAAAEQSIGTAFAAIDQLPASDSTAGKLYLMPNDGTTPTGTELFITVQTGATTYMWYRLGALSVPSNVLTEDKIVQNLTTGGSDKVLSGEVGVQIVNVIGRKLISNVPVGEGSTGRLILFTNTTTVNSVGWWYNKSSSATGVGGNSSKYITIPVGNTEGSVAAIGDKLVVKNSGTLSGKLLLFLSSQIITSGTTPTSGYFKATNYIEGSQTEIPADNTEVEVIVPKGAAYLYLTLKRQGDDVATFNITKHHLELDNLPEMIDELSEETNVKLSYEMLVYGGNNPLNGDWSGYLATDSTHGKYRKASTIAKFWCKRLNSIGTAAGNIMRVTANSSYSAYVAFVASWGGYARSSWAQESAVTLVGEGTTINAGETANLIIPEGTNRIWIRTINTSGNDTTPDNVVFTTSLKEAVNNLQQKIDDAGNAALAYSIEERVTRMKSDIMTKLKWTPQAATMPWWRKSNGTMQNYPIATYTGLPYSSNEDHAKWLGTHVSLYTFMTAIMNKYSLLYTEQVRNNYSQSAWGYVYTSSDNGSSYYGTVCCAFTGYTMGCNVVWNNPRIYALVDVAFDMIQTHEQDGHKFDLNKLKVGDVLNDQNHSMLIYELKYDNKGMVTGFIATEATSETGSTPTGSGAQTDTMTVAAAVTRFDHFRFKYFGQNTEIDPNVLSMFDNDGNVAIEYNHDICTIAGDKCTFTNYSANGYNNSNVIALNYNLNDDVSWEYDTIVVKNVDTEEEESYTIANIDDSGYNQYEQGHALLLSSLQSGKYEAWCEISGDSVQSEKTSFIVVGVDDFTISKTNEYIRVTANKKEYRISYVAVSIDGSTKGRKAPGDLQPNWTKGSQNAENDNQYVELSASEIADYNVENEYVLTVDVKTEYGIQRIKGVIA